MNENPTNTEEKIISATIDCIEKYGISGATNRRIAEDAGVNIAAINYYFRSKDVLIQRVMEITLKNAFDFSDIPPMPGATAQERCTAIFLDILRGGLRYAGITRAHFHRLLADGQPDAMLQEHVNRFVDHLAEDLQERGLRLEMQQLKLAILQIFSGIVMAVLAPSFFEPGGVNINDPETSQDYVAQLVEKLLVE